MLEKSDWIQGKGRQSDGFVGNVEPIIISRACPTGCVESIAKKAKLELLDELAKPCPYTYTSPGHTVEFWLKKYCPYCLKEIRKELEEK